MNTCIIMVIEILQSMSNKITSLLSVSDRIQILGLLSDIIGSWFILNIFFKLSNEKHARKFVEKSFDMQFLKRNKGPSDGFRDNIRGNGIRAMKSLKDFYKKIGKDARTGFLFLILGLALQVFAKFL